MENYYQFSKVYRDVPYSKQRYSRWDSTIIWEHPAETHVNDNDELLPEYWTWREKGMKCEYAVRYPVGYGHRSKCLFSVSEKDKTRKLNYIESRKLIYVPEYTRLVRQKEQYALLLNKLRKGENLLIIDVDGPHEESLEYYRQTYVDKWRKEETLENNTMLATEEMCNIMLNDEKHPYGHGYCLAMALLRDK